MEIPEPEPECKYTINYDLDQLTFFLLFTGAGVGWFVMGYLLSDCCYYRTKPNQRPILAENVY